MRNHKPIIGLTSSYEKTDKADYVFSNHSYLNSIRRFGGIPLIIPTEGEDDELEVLVGLCDGILLSGGDDIDPALYGEEALNDTLQLTPVRDAVERKVCDLAVKRELPMFGICRGVQMMNVYFGGSLYQDIPAQIETDIKHRMDPPAHRTCHQCIIEKDTPLYELIGREEIGVNSHHHQAVKSVAPGFTVMGRAEDGIVEAIYDPSRPFVWGVQWHPERIWDIEDSSAKLFEAFIEACKNGR
ncbi:MAG: gamma-glutamyl-gamma-aminobutyrate hydrolase family protein [Lachnospiraceae bacterium]|nr:gamma-glutamyl-gamma-aminobutyrate hydrolase family protein [Lachnospiraceae bacterium]